MAWAKRLATSLASMVLTIPLLATGGQAAGSGAIQVETTNADVVVNSATPEALASQLPSLGGALPTVGQDGHIGYVSYFEEGLGASPLASVVGSNGPIDVPPGVDIYNTAVWEFEIDEASARREVSRLKSLLRSDEGDGGSNRYKLTFVKDDWFVDPWVLNPNANTAIPVPLATTCTSDEFTAGDLRANNGWILVWCDLGGNLVPVWSLTEFFVDPTPFVRSGQIEHRDEFVPFGIRLELLPLNFRAFDEINPAQPATTETTGVGTGFNGFTFERVNGG